MDTLDRFALIIADTDGWGHMNGLGGGWMWLWGTLMMFSWVALIAGAVWLFSRGRDNSTTSATSSRARHILDERYARGDLSTEEYRERLEHLSRPALTHHRRSHTMSDTGHPNDEAEMPSGTEPTAPASPAAGHDMDSRMMWVMMLGCCLAIPLALIIGGASLGGLAGASPWLIGVGVVLAIALVVTRRISIGPDANAPTERHG